MDANPGLDITKNKTSAEEIIIEKDKEFTIDFNISTASDVVVKINNVEIASANNKTEYKLQHTFTSAGKKTIEIKKQKMTRSSKQKNTSSSSYKDPRAI